MAVKNSEKRGANPDEERSVSIILLIDMLMVLGLFGKNGLAQESYQTRPITMIIR